MGALMSSNGVSARQWGLSETGNEQRKIVSAVYGLDE